MKMHHALAIFVASTIALVSLGAAIGFSQTDEPGITLVISTLPPPPTPLPPLRVPNHSVFAEDLAAAVPDGTQGTVPGGLGNASVPENYGVIGVSLDTTNPNNNIASVLSPTGLAWVHVGDKLNNKTIIRIDMDGLELNDGTHIRRALSTDGSSTNLIVPPITQPLPTVSPTDANPVTTTTTVRQPLVQRPVVQQQYQQSPQYQQAPLMLQPSGTINQANPFSLPTPVTTIIATPTATGGP